MMYESKTHRLYLFGEVRYRDIFGKEHFTKFRMVNNVKPRTDRFTFCSEGNETDD